MDDVTTKSDAALIKETLQDKERFTMLVMRYEESLRRYVRRLGVWNREDQDDVLQNIFIKIYRNLHGFDQKLKFSSWAYRIAHNEVVTSYRYKSVRPEGHAVHDGDEVVSATPDHHSLLAELSESYDAEILRLALSNLDQKYRDVLILRYFEEREYDEIADILEMPIGSVSTRIYRAKERLKSLLAESLRV
jgi:RNA polymerase sigma-70 factor, ECF subfamily